MYLSARAHHCPKTSLSDHLLLCCLNTRHHLCFICSAAHHRGNCSCCLSSVLNTWPCYGIQLLGLRAQTVMEAALGTKTNPWDHACAKSWLFGTPLEEDKLWVLIWDHNQIGKVIHTMMQCNFIHLHRVPIKCPLLLPKSCLCSVHFPFSDPILSWESWN